MASSCPPVLASKAPHATCWPHRWAGWRARRSAHRAWCASCGCARAGVPALSRPGALRRRRRWRLSRRLPRSPGRLAGFRGPGRGQDPAPLSSECGILQAASFGGRSGALSGGGWGRCGGEVPLPLSPSPRPGSGVGEGVLGTASWGRLRCLAAVSDPLTVGVTPSRELLFWVPGRGVKGEASCPFLGAGRLDGTAGPPFRAVAFPSVAGERDVGPAPAGRGAKSLQSFEQPLG